VERTWDMVGNGGQACYLSLESTAEALHPRTTAVLWEMEGFVYKSTV